ncbi:MAG TPA: alpha-2-macroglobulin family protein [Kofleriaceae bacterium]|nr:alpha-2-macroglobulin family protein [Kofleriaceae bacterium]
MRRFQLVSSILCAAALAAACKGRSADNERAGYAELAAREPLALKKEMEDEPSAAGSGGAAPDDMDRADGQYEMPVQNDAPGAPALARQQAIEEARTAGILGSAALKSSAFKAASVKGEPAPARRPEGPTRAWFPETFLFEPLVVTDDTGAATVPVRVPDRLTTWRVLALGHSRQGAQGGAVTSFLGTLPAYVDPVIPPFLVAGDEIRLPIQMINTTNEPIASELSLEAQPDAGALTGPRGARTIPAQGSLVEYATLKAARPGAIKLRVGLGATDFVERSIDVAPGGRPVSVTRSGTLAAPRTLSIEGPAGADPATARVRLMVFPGALALLRSELSISTARSGVTDDAYALLLAGRAPTLLSQLGDKADPEVLRNLSIIAGQRVIRHARRLDVPAATAVAAAALAHPGSPVLARLGERAAEHLYKNQRPDGTFEGGQGWTLQRVLVATAAGTRAVAAADGTPAARQRAQAVAFRAAGAFERNVEAVPDAYTAAAILATRALKGSGPIADKLRQRVRDAVKGDDSGKWLEVGPGVVRPDGTVPGRAEATALAVLALDGDAKAAALRADLGATLLGSYSPAHGWGDGRANLECMMAVLALFQTQLPASVQVSLTLDGKLVATGNFDREKLRDVLVLEGATGQSVAGAHEWRVTAEPAVPGLGYSLALQSYVPWPKETVKAGLELQLPAAVTAAVGKPSEIVLTAVAPSGMTLHITHALPAGVQADRPSLEALVGSDILSRFEIADGKVELYAPALDPGEVLTAKYRLIPTFAGKLQSGPSVIRAGTHEVYVPPSQWTIR